MKQIIKGEWLYGNTLFFSDKNIVVTFVEFKDACDDASLPCRCLCRYKHVHVHYV